MMKFPKNVLSFYFKNLYRYAKAWPWLFMLFSLFDTAGHTVIPAFFVKFTVGTLENATGLDAFVQVFYIAIAYLAIRGLLVGGAVMRWTVFDNTIKYKSYNKISRDLYNYVFNQTLEYYSDSMPGKINAQIDSVAVGFYEMIGMVFGNAMATIGAFILSFGGLFVIGWQYVVVILLAVFGRVGWSMWRIKHALKAAAKTSGASNVLHGRLLDALSNFAVVKAFANSSYEQQCAEPYRDNYEKTARNGHAVSRWMWAPGNFMMDALGMAALIIVCGYMYMTGQSDLADVSFALTLFTGISAVSFTLLMQVKDFIERLGKSVGSYDGLIEPIKIKDAKNAKDLVVKSAKVEIRKLSFKYNKQMVLKDVTFTVNPGERVGIVGLSGAGKTTLVNLIMRFYDCVSGAIYIDGTDIKKVTQKSLHQNIAFIPQDTTMFNRTIRENIAYGRIGASDEDIFKAAHNAAADDFILTAPKKYDTIVGDRGIKLSGGQRQRISIARAFLKDAPILVLDEATSALDSETEDAIQKSFATLSKNRTTIVIAHRLSTLRNMDKLIVLDKGRIVETGTHKQLLSKNGIYAKLWKMQSGGFISE